MVPAPSDDSRSSLATSSGPSKRAATPEPLSEGDVLAMRRRAQEIYLSASGGQIMLGRNITNTGPALSTSPTAREKELAEMVLRLTDPLPIDPAQLIRQAETISDLTAYRDYLMKELQEERERLNAERDSWERSAEALLMQRAKPPKSEDAGRQREIYEAEARALRAKLRDTQQRLSQLENDTQRFKPLLFIGQHEPKPLDKGKGREMQSTNPQQASQATSSNELRSRSSRERSHGTSRSSKRRHTPFTSDAYSEHFLLAAKRIGRARATQISGLIHYAEHEKDVLTREQQRVHDVREQERLERERLDRLATGTSGLAYYRSTAEGIPQRVPAAPHTPKKQIHYGPSAASTPIVFVHTLSPPTPVPQATTAMNNISASVTYVGSPLASSQILSHSGTGAIHGSHTQTSQTLSNPPTPLDSLLDAARMMDDGDDATPRRPIGKRPIQDPDSPIPKRRRVATTGMGTSSSVSSASAPPRRQEENADTFTPQGRKLGKDRVRSALDVLADQADQASAAFNEPEQSSRSPAPAAASNAKDVTRNGMPPSSDRHQDIASPPMSFIQVDPSSSSSTPTAMRGRARSRGRLTNTHKRSLDNGPTSSTSIPTQSTTSISPAGSTPKTTQATTSASGRPQRAAAKRNPAASPASISSRTRTPSTSSVRGTSKLRGRSRGTNNVKASAAKSPSLARSEPRIISPSNARLISPAQLSVPDVGRKEHVLEENSLLPGSQINQLIMPTQTVQTFAQMDSQSSFSPTREHGPEKAQLIASDVVDRDQSYNIQSIAESSRLVDSASDTSIQEVGTNKTRCTPSSTKDTSVHDVEMYAPGPEDGGDTDVDAEADADMDEDADAEGEQEEEMDDAPKDSPPRSKSPSPPPPDPAPPGSNSGLPRQNYEHNSDADADADAEGDVDFEEGEGSMTGGSPTQGTQSMMQVPLTVSDKGPALQTVNHTRAKHMPSPSVTGNGDAHHHCESFLVEGAGSTRVKLKQRIHSQMAPISRISLHG